MAPSINFGNNEEEEDLPTIEELREPTHTPYVSKEDLDLTEMAKRDIKLMLASSVFSQNDDWLIRVALQQNKQIIRNRAEIRSLRNWRKGLRTRFAIYAGIFSFFFASLGGAIAQKISDSIFNFLTNEPPPAKSSTTDLSTK